MRENVLQVIERRNSPPICAVMLNLVLGTRICISTCKCLNANDSPPFPEAHHVRQVSILQGTVPDQGLSAVGTGGSDHLYSIRMGQRCS